jgi:hypothetical protein
MNCNHTPGMVFVDSNTKVSIWMDIRNDTEVAKPLLKGFEPVGIYCGNCRKLMSDNEILEAIRLRITKPGFMHWLTKPRNSFLDSAFSASFVVSLVNQQWLTALCIAVIGILYSPLLTRHFHGAPK